MNVNLTDKNSETIMKYSHSCVDDEIFLSWWINFNYFVYCKDTEIKLNFITTWENTRWNVFVLLYWKWTNMSDISAKINHSYCDINVFVYSFLQDDNLASIDWDIVISSRVYNSKWNLMEKNILIWSSAKVKATPRLDVYSPDVHATHGVSIDKIWKDSLIYLQSRWLSYRNSISLMVTWYITNILDYFKWTDMDEKTKISQSILTDINLLDD